MPGPFAASEDCGLFGAAWGVPAVFWVIGGVDPDTYDEAEKASKLDTLPVRDRGINLRHGLEVIAGRFWQPYEAIPAARDVVELRKRVPALTQL